MLPQKPDDGGILRAFRDDPLASPLPTPSGKVQVDFACHRGLRLCRLPGHPAWLAPTEAPDDAPSVMAGREPAGYTAAQPARFRCPQPGGEAAGSRGLQPASDRCRQSRHPGRRYRSPLQHPRCLPRGGQTDRGRMPGVIRLPTGAWYDPQSDAQGRPLCAHGNPNVLTRDIGTSSLAQGCAGQTHDRAGRAIRRSAAGDPDIRGTGPVGPLTPRRRRSQGRE